MAKSNRALSGAAKDAFLRRAIRNVDGIPEPARDCLTSHLQGRIALISLKTSKAGHAADGFDDRGSSSVHDAVTETADDVAPDDLPPASVSQPAFDPYHPNVIVIFRTHGREAVLAQLADIADVEQLRLLAREQQLGIAPGLASAIDIRQAIVTAAERRIANRRAAAR